MIRVEIFTDGACSGNPGHGGWGALLRCRGVEKELSGGEKETTNNRMELAAVISALAALKTSCDISLYTDSKYVMDGITRWLPNWKKNGWKTVQGTSVLNRDLWTAIDGFMERHRILFQRVKGHVGTRYNELCDRLAKEEAKDHR